MNSNDVKNIAIVGGMLFALSYLKKQFEPAQLPVNSNNLTYSNAVYISAADVIEEAFWFAWQIPFPFLDTEKSMVIVETLELMQSDDDVAFLFNTYGERCRPAPSVLCTPETIPSSILYRLDQDFRDMINQDFEEKGINWRL